jgi:murein DD-endopeptidase MepM/ murein hydrolase activator NlpD
VTSTIGTVTAIATGGGERSSTEPTAADPVASTAAESVPSTAAESVPTSTPTTAAPATTAPASTARPTTTADPTTTTAPATPRYVVPVVDVAVAGWTAGHAGYPATDIFAACGTGVVAPVGGELLEVRRVDGWDPAIDNPATRGGRSVTIHGDDGVRYYLSHLDRVAESLSPGRRVAAGQRLGTVGLTGRTSACHVHFGISPPCPGPEWSVRRGAVEPAPYLDAWRSGTATSPADEVAAWIAANPDACAEAMADPDAADS